MSRWVSVPLNALRAPEFARVSIHARLVWLALRVAHFEHYGAGGLPSRLGSAEALSLLAPGVLKGVRVDAGRQQLLEAGLLSEDGGELRLMDFEACELPKCNRCGKRSPSPGRRCPTCIADDAKRGTTVEARERAKKDGFVGGGESPLRKGIDGVLDLVEKSKSCADPAQNCAEPPSATHRPHPTLPTRPTYPTPTSATHDAPHHGRDEEVVDDATAESRAVAGNDAPGGKDAAELYQILETEGLFSRSRNRGAKLLSMARRLAGQLSTADLRRLVQVAHTKSSPMGWLKTVLQNETWQSELG